ncbi:MAG: DUF1194 domain-containing protein [Paracoccaceae bacterium]
MTRLLATLLALLAAPAWSEPCRLSLALALDVSGSVDATEYQLQAHGLAHALSDEKVRRLLFALPDSPVAVAVYEWSASRYQRMIVDWVRIEDDAALNGVIDRLMGIVRAPAPEPTGLAAALVFGKALIDDGPTCWDQTLDVSADGKNNDWPTPRELRETRALAGLRINALVIVEDRDEVRPGARETGELPAYFKAHVIQGPGAFVEVARGFEDYTRAMTRKLVRELATQPLGSLEMHPRNIPRRF